MPKKKRNVPSYARSMGAAFPVSFTSPDEYLRAVDDGEKQHTKSLVTHLRRRIKSVRRHLDK